MERLKILFFIFELHIFSWAEIFYYFCKFLYSVELSTWFLNRDIGRYSTNASRLKLSESKSYSVPRFRVVSVLKELHIYTLHST